MLGVNGLTINNFVTFLIEFSFSILFLIVFSAIHFTLIKKTKLEFYLAKSKVIGFWYYFVFGAVLSLITFIVSWSVEAASIGSMLSLPITILSLIVAMTFYYNRSVQIGALLPSIFWVLWSFKAFDGFSWAWCSRLLVVLIAAIVSIAATFFKTKKWPTYLISIAIICVASIAATAWLWKDDSLIYVLEILLALFSALVFYAIINWLNKFLKTMSYMAKTSLYSDEGYIIPSALDNQFAQFIKKNNIDQALVVIFNINNPTKHTLEAIAKKFQSTKSLLFKSQYGTYGVILCDNLYHITNIQISCQNNNQPKRLVPDSLAFLENDLKKFNFTSFVSVYGIHSYDLNELIRFNHYAIKQFDQSPTTNSIQFFDSNMLNNELKDEINYAQLIQKVNLDEIDIQLETIKVKNKNIQLIAPRYYWTKMFTCDINQILNEFDPQTSKALLRCLAIKTIEQYSMSKNKGNIPLMIYYPITELTNPYFAINQFIKKLKLYGLDRNDIILSFDCKKMKIWPNVIIDNLIEMQNNNVKYMFIDLINTYPLTLLKPTYIILDRTIESNDSKFEKALEVINKYQHNVLLSK